MKKLIHFENTSRCNAKCPMCARNINGEGLAVSLDDLNLKRFQTIVLENFKTLEKVFFCGSVGDPCADKDLLQKIKWLKETKSSVVVGINTNGSIRNNTWWQECATLLNGSYDYVVFSIDGLEDTNNIHRVGVVWKKIMENAKAFIDAGGTAHWDMLVFEHNKHQIGKIKKLAYDMGFSWFRCKETDRWDQFSFDHLKPANDYSALDYNSLEVDCERNRDESLYVDYKGNKFPCCHIGEMWYSKTQRHRHKDMLSYSPKQLMTEYQRRLNNNDPFYICKRCCGKDINKPSQFKLEIQLR